MIEPPKRRVACIEFKTPRELTPFAEACLRFTPEIALRSDQAIFLEIGKSRTLYTEESFIQRVQVILKRFGDDWVRDARIAIADDATCAFIRARYEVENPFDSLSALDLDSLHDFADPFLLSEKNRPLISKMITTLRRLSLHQVDQFMQIPASELPSRFGSWSLYVRSQIDLRLEMQWPKWKPLEIIEEQMELVSDDYCHWLEPLLFHCKVLLDRLYSRLQGRGLRCARLHVELKLEVYSTVKQPVRTFDFDFMMPQGTSRSTLKILQERFERELAARPLESAVKCLRIEARETTPGYQRQQNLFNQHEEIAEAFASIAAHLSESLGKDHVFRAVIQEERFPEKSWTKRTSDQETHADVKTVLATRPSRLLSKPREVAITRDRVILKKDKSYTIQSWSRVECISADWLTSPVFEATTRKYYQVEIAEGPALWIFENEQQQFFLHGWFE